MDSNPLLPSLLRLHSENCIGSKLIASTDFPSKQITYLRRDCFFAQKGFEPLSFGLVTTWQTTTPSWLAIKGRILRVFTYFRICKWKMHYEPIIWASLSVHLSVVPMFDVFDQRISTIFGTMIPYHSRPSSFNFISKYPISSDHRHYWFYHSNAAGFECFPLSRFCYQIVEMLQKHMTHTNLLVR